VLNAGSPCGLKATPARVFLGLLDGNSEESAGSEYTGDYMSNQASTSSAGKFADNIEQWERDKLVLRLNEVLTLGLSLCVMAALAFIACAAIQ
jgi:hypothetical protein